MALRACAGIRGVGGSVADLAAAFRAFSAASVALVRRFRTGQAQHLDVSLASIPTGRAMTT